MTYLAIQVHLDGKSVQWMESVSEEQYRALAPSGLDRHRVHERATDWKRRLDNARMRRRFRARFRAHCLPRDGVEPERNTR
jgi:hypothetical protein